MNTENTSIPSPYPPHPDAPFKAKQVGVHITAKDVDSNKWLDGYKLKIEWYWKPMDPNKPPERWKDAVGEIDVVKGKGKEGALIWVNTNPSHTNHKLQMRILAWNFQDPYRGVAYESPIMDVPAENHYYPILFAQNP